MWKYSYGLCSSYLDYSFHNGWRKERVFKKVISCFKERNVLHTSSSISRAFPMVSIWKDTGEIHFSRIFKNNIVFCSNEETPNLALHKVSPLRSLLLFLLMQSKHYSLVRQVNHTCDQRNNSHLSYLPTCCRQKWLKNGQQCLF